MKTPFRYDFVGSFLRPQRLKDARKDFEEGKITQADLTKVEDECIVDLVNENQGTWLPCYHRRRVQKIHLAS